MRRLVFLAALAAIALPALPASAGPLSVVVVGDDLSDPYAGYAGPSGPNWGSGGDQNWTELIQKYRAGGTTLYNYSLAGSTMEDLYQNGSTTLASAHVQAVPGAKAVVIAGSNDILNFVQNPGHTKGLVKQVSENLNATLTKVAATAGLVVGNIPDLAVTPEMKALVPDPTARAQLSQLIKAVNDAIFKVTEAHGGTVVDLYGLSHAAADLLDLGGADLPDDKKFAPDGFHPGTVLQGLLGNTILAALGDKSGLRLSDQELLGAVGLTAPTPGPTFYDVSGFVQKTPEPASAVLLVIAVGFAGTRYRRRAA
jgi:phospholipase/lecithinase/hemolysin